MGCLHFDTSSDPVGQHPPATDVPHSVPQQLSGTGSQLGFFQRLVIAVEHRNLTKRRVNVWKQDKRCEDPNATVSEEEVDDPMPDVVDFADIANADACDPVAGNAQLGLSHQGSGEATQGAPSLMAPLGGSR